MEKKNYPTPEEAFFRPKKKDQQSEQEELKANLVASCLALFPDGILPLTSKQDHHAHHGASLFALVNYSQNKVGENAKKQELLRVTWGALSPHTFTRDYPNPFCDKQTKQALEILLRFPTQLYCVSCQDSWLADQETKQLAQNDPSSYLKEKSIFQVFDQEKPHAISAEALFKFLQHPNSLKFFFPNTKPLPKAHLST